MTVPHSLTNVAGSYPDADKYMDNWNVLESLINGNQVANGGMEIWNSATSFTNPANAATLADNWTLAKSGTSAATANVTRETTNIDTGTYSMKIDLTVAGSSDSIYAITQNIGTPTRLKNQYVLFGVRVKASTANKVRAKISDGTTTSYSSYHTGDGTWQNLQVTIPVAAAVATLTVTVEINPSNFTGAVYIDSIVLYAIPAAIAASAAAKAALTYSAVPLTFLPTSGGVMTGPITTLPAGTGIGSAANLTQVGYAQKNHLVNGSFEIWQRNTTFSSPASGAYTADRWYCEKGGAPTFTIARDTGIRSGGPGTYCGRLNVTSVGTGTSIHFTQKVEHVKELRGRTICVSAWIKCNAASHAEIYIADGVGSGRSGFHTGGGAWEYMSATITVSTSATTLYIYIGGVVSCVVSDTYVDDVMMTISDVAMPYIPLHPAEELERCQRYYETGGGWFGALGYSDGTYYVLDAPHYWTTPKGGAATITVTLDRAQEEGAATDVKATYSGTATVHSQMDKIHGFSYEIYKAIGGAKPCHLRTTFVAEWNP